MSAGADVFMELQRVSPATKLGVCHSV